MLLKVNLNHTARTISYEIYETAAETAIFHEKIVSSLKKILNLSKRHPGKLKDTIKENH